MKTHIKSRVGTRQTVNCSLQTDMNSGQSEITIDAAITFKVPTNRIERINRLWEAFNNEVEKFCCKSEDMINPKGFDDYELTDDK